MIKTQMANSNVITLNAGQQEAADKFMRFLLSSDREFVLSGPAGVGKTYLVSYLLQHVIPETEKALELLGEYFPYTSIDVVATTNKAADVLSQATQRDVTTLHSFLSLSLSNNFTTGETKLIKKENWAPIYNTIVLIDESSMISRDLYKIMQETLINCKIVYIGDHLQLAPVKETLSKVYQQNYPADAMHRLEQQMRNDEQPALMALCTQLRDMVKTGVQKPIQLVPGVIDHVTKEDCPKLLEAMFTEDPTRSLQLPGLNRVLAYTNKKVIQYNEYIRSIQGKPLLPTNGETYINNTPYKTGKSIVPAETEVTIIKVQPQKLIMKYSSEIQLSYYQHEMQIKGTGEHVFAQVPVDAEHYKNLLKYAKKTKNWSVYFNLLERFADLRPFDAATVHKAQGSSYDHVLLDLTDMSTCNIKDMLNRMLYVGVSRARKRVFLYGQIEPKYPITLLPPA